MEEEGEMDAKKIVEEKKDWEKRCLKKPLIESSKHQSGAAICAA